MSYKSEAAALCLLDVALVFVMCCACKTNNSTHRTREVFRATVFAGSAAIIIMHSHPSGEPDPSETDIKVTRDLVRAGQILNIEVLDHVIMGNPRHCSLRELGFFFQ